MKSKINFFYLVCMGALLFVHNFNYGSGQLAPSTVLHEGAGIGAMIELFFSNSFFRFRMGLIMAISGYLMAKPSDKSYQEMIVMKTKTLLIPFLMVSIIGLLITMVLELVLFGYRPNGAGLLGMSVFGLSARSVFYYLVVNPVPFQLWYLKVIFVMALLSPVVRFVLDRFALPALLLLTGIWLFTNYLDGETRDRCFVFYFFGFYLRLRNINIGKAHRWVPAKAVFALFLGLCVVRTWLAVAGLPESFHVSYLLTLSYKLTEIAGAYSVWFGFDGVVRAFNLSRSYSKYGKSSFFIFAFHAPFICFVTEIAARLGCLDLPFAHIGLYFLMPLALFFGLARLDYLVKVHCPVFYGLLTGGRGIEFSTRPVRIRETLLHFFMGHRTGLAA